MKNFLSAISVLSIVGIVAASVAVYANAIGLYHENKNNDFVSATDNAAAIPAVSNATTTSATEETISADASVRILDVAVSQEDVTKDDIIHMMLNSIDYYDCISGTIYFPTGELQYINSVEFQSSLSETSAYSHYTQMYAENISNSADEIFTANTASNNAEAIVWEEEDFCSSDSTWITINHTDNTYVHDQNAAIPLEAVCEIPDDERIQKAGDGQISYQYRTNPTNVPEASICIFPQEMAFGFLADTSRWEINGVEQLDGNDCYTISGQTTEAYGNQVNVSTFEFWVDINTGVLLQYIGYGEDGEITDYLYTENIRFGEDAQHVTAFSEAMINGYEDISWKAES